MKRRAERIDSIISSVIKKLDSGSMAIAEDIENAWRQVAGRKAAGHSKPASLRKKKLTINVDGSGWLYELSLKKDELLHGLKKRLGSDKINQLQLRIGEL